MHESIAELERIAKRLRQQDARKISPRVNRGAAAFVRAMQVWLEEIEREGAAG